MPSRNIYLWLLLFLAASILALNTLSYVSLQEKSVQLAERDSNAALNVRPVPVQLACVDKKHDCSSRVKQSQCSSFTSLLDDCMASCESCSAVARLVSAASSSLGFSVTIVNGTIVCEDAGPGCKRRAAQGLCDSMSDPGVFACKATCGVCNQTSLSDQTKPSSTESVCMDRLDICSWMADHQMCDEPTHSWWVVPLCQKSCGMCAAGTTSSNHLVRLGRTSSEETFLSKFSSYDLGDDCKDTKESCTSWSAAGECIRNPGFMSQACPRSCGACHRAWLPNPPPIVILGNGVAMPMIGFGTAGLGGGGGTYRAVLAAIKMGYRHIDSAQAREWYQEGEVGEAVHDSGIPRDQFFITSKLHPRHLGYEVTMSQFDESLKDLRTPYIDQFLLHYPECWGSLCEEKPAGTWQDSWRALEELYGQGKIRAIGVSNFNLEQMHQLINIATIHPSTLQVMVDPLAPSTALQDFCVQHGIQLVAYSTLGTQHARVGPRNDENPVLTNPVITRIANRYNVSTAVVTLRWAIQLGVAVLPRSSNEGHMKQNLRVFDLHLSEQDMRAISALAA